MKKFFLLILLLLITFIGLTYWSVSVGPSEVRISELMQEEKTSEELNGGEPVTVKTTNLYESNKLKRFMQGENYREAWKAPVQAEVFLLDSFNIQKEGGGNQTKSLKIKDRQGVLYSLRSVNKDPDPLIPKIATTLGLENVVIDGVSAQHPYGAVLAAALADVAEILHTHPRIVYVPQHEAMDDYAERYGDRLFLLEYETEGEVNWTSFPNVQEIVETDDLQEMKLRLQDSLKIDYRQLVRARLFDLLIGDWDRHTKQWGWVLQKKEEGLLAIPLPGDRDNAFFRIDGVIPTILTNHVVQPMVRPFEKDIDHIPGFVYPFDLYFLKGIPEDIFIEEAKFLQEKLSDAKIAAALEQWPQRLVELNGKEIASNLKHRRDDLQKYALKFRKVIEESEFSREPLKGSEDLELPPGLLKCFECN